MSTRVRKSDRANLKKWGLKYCTKCRAAKELGSFYDQTSRASWCKDCIRAQVRDYKRRNKGKLKSYRNPEREREREKQLDRKIRCKLRKKLRRASWDNGREPELNDSMLGCNVQYLIRYLEGRFYANPETGEEMTWGNRGFRGWHIDHVIPLAKFRLEDEEQYRAAGHYRNLKPMWYEENREKESEIVLEELEDWHVEVCQRFGIVD